MSKDAAELRNNFVQVTNEVPCAAASLSTQLCSNARHPSRCRSSATSTARPSR